MCINIKIDVYCWSVNLSTYLSIYFYHVSIHGQPIVLAAEQPHEETAMISSGQLWPESRGTISWKYHRITHFEVVDVDRFHFQSCSLYPHYTSIVPPWLLVKLHFFSSFFRVQSLQSPFIGQSTPSSSCLVFGNLGAVPLSFPGPPGDTWLGNHQANNIRRPGSTRHDFYDWCTTLGADLPRVIQLTLKWYRDDPFSPTIPTYSLNMVVVQSIVKLPCQCIKGKHQWIRLTIFHNYASEYIM